MGSRAAWVLGICFGGGNLVGANGAGSRIERPGLHRALAEQQPVQARRRGVVFRPEFNDVLVSEYGSSEVTSVDPSTGAKTLFAPIPPRLNSGPSEIAVNSQGDVYVKEHAGGPIYRFSSNGAPLSPDSFFPPSCSSPAGMAFDSADNFYVTCIPTSFDGKILKFAPNTFTSPTVFASGLPTLLGIQFNPAGKLFTAGFDCGKIFEVAPGGTTLGSHTQWASGLNCPANVAFDPASGDVFASSTDSVVRISSPGNVTTFASGFPWDGVVGDCDGTYALDFDPQGCLYVDEFTSGELWRFCPSGSSPAPSYPAPRFASPVRASPRAGPQAVRQRWQSHERRPCPSACGGLVHAAEAGFGRPLRAPVGGIRPACDRLRRHQSRQRGPGGRKDPLFALRYRDGDGRGLRPEPGWRRCNARHAASLYRSVQRRFRYRRRNSH